MAIFDDGAGGPRPHLPRPSGYRVDHTFQHQRQAQPSRVRSGYVFILPRSNGTAPVPPGQRKRTRHRIHPRSTANPTSPYGALARDGVSCAVCHHMADKNLDDPSTYTGKFIAGPANVVYGPYPSGDGNVKVGDNVIPRADDKLCGNSTGIWSSDGGGKSVRLLPHDRAPGL